MKIVKYIRWQDSGLKQHSGFSGETSINLSNEIFDFLSSGMVDDGEECGVTFKIFKEDFEQAIAFILSQLPLYKTTSRDYMLFDTDSDLIPTLRRNMDRFFGKEEAVDYTIILYRRKDLRIYLKGLRQYGFSLRDYLVENSSALVFDLVDDVYELRLLSGYYDGDIE
jgi:hypothetical protein